LSKAPEQAKPSQIRAEWESAGKRLLFMAMQQQNKKQTRKNLLFRREKNQSVHKTAQHEAKRSSNANTIANTLNKSLVSSVDAKPAHQEHSYPRQSLHLVVLVYHAPMYMLLWISQVYRHDRLT
jgi:hypothetical protein